MVEHSYKTILEPSEALFKDRGSKFIAYAHPVSTLQEITDLLNAFRREHHKANHVCYAYHLNERKGEYRANDDGEPSNSAGTPILGQIKSFGLSYVLVAVVRYFGGTKLGVPGLINAYRSATKEALGLAEVVHREFFEIYTLRFSHAIMHAVMHHVKSEGFRILEQAFLADCTLSIQVPTKKSEACKAKLLSLGVVLE